MYSSYHNIKHTAAYRAGGISSISGMKIMTASWRHNRARKSAAYAHKRYQQHISTRRSITAAIIGSSIGNSASAAYEAIGADARIRRRSGKTSRYQASCGGMTSSQRQISNRGISIGGGAYRGVSRARRSASKEPICWRGIRHGIGSIVRKHISA